MIRAFIALDISEDVRRKLEELKNHLAPYGRNVKWVPVKNIHITLKFLGNISEDRISDIEGVIRKLLQNRSSISLRAKGAGAFPSLKKIRVVWAGIDGDIDKLRSLQQDLEVELERIGFPREDRSFKPHLTLGRLKSPSGNNSLAKAIAGLHSFQSDQFVVDHVTLYRSILKPSGAVYEALVKVPFAK